MSGSTSTPARIAAMPTPLGPPNLWALNVSTSTCGQIVAQVEPAGRLDGVGVEHGVGRAGAHERGEGGEVIDGADLVVDRHDRHHADALGPAGEGLLERVTQRGRVDAAQLVDVDDGAP